MKIDNIVDTKRIREMPDEINWKIFSFLTHNTASILVDAFWKNKLNLKHIYFPKLSHKVWNELRPSYLESNVYGSGMYIIRTKIRITEKLLLLS
jgi:hypothetical protein